MGEFEKHERLGAGHFGEVWLEFDRALGVDRAIKYIIPQNVTSPHEVFREAQLLAKLSHPNIIPVHEAGRLEDGTIYIVMDHCRRGSVESRFKGRALAMKKARKILVDILRGLEYAHANKILHRDIKPANILCKNATDYMLSDFGLAIPLDSATPQKIYGYVSHLAPEVITRGRFGEGADVYAAGVTAYRLINGDSMITAFPTVQELKDNIVRGTHPRRDKYKIYVPRKLRAVVNKALEIDPGRRFRSAKEFRHSLEQVNIHCSWRENAVKDGTLWKTEEGGTVTEVQVLRSALGVFTLSVHRGPSVLLRQVHAFDYSSRREVEILRRVAQITQRMTERGKLPSPLGGN
jgi:serine/threonine protein kinase